MASEERGSIVLLRQLKGKTVQILMIESGAVTGKLLQVLDDCVEVEAQKPAGRRIIVYMQAIAYVVHE